NHLPSSSSPNSIPSSLPIQTQITAMVKLFSLTRRRTRYKIFCLIWRCTSGTNEAELSPSWHSFGYWERHIWPVVSRVVVAAAVVKVEDGSTHFSANIQFVYLCLGCGTIVLLFQRSSSCH
nr:hypothetical protein [Tanacetum cinerariifolium]